MLMLEAFFLQCFLCVTVSGFCYISPVAVVNESCTVSDNTTLRPCYTLQEISSTSLPCGDVTSTEMIFLPGIHVINQSLVFSDTAEVEVYPWDEQHVVIECQLNANWTFEHIEELRLSSLHFNYCHLKASVSQFTAIENCVFTGSRHAYAMDFDFFDFDIPAQNSSIYVGNCTFSSNNGGIHFAYYISRSNIYIEDSLFVNNWRDSGDKLGGAIQTKGHTNLILEESQFINNTVITSSNNTIITGSGGAIYCDSFAKLLIISTIFQSNTANWGGAIYAGRLEIFNCKFVNNSAEYSGGAISSDISWYILPILLIVHNSTFENNHCNEDGGAILFHYSGVDDFKVQGCEFKNNSAQMGGAIMLKYEGNYAPPELHSIVESTSFQGNFANKFGGAIYLMTVTVERSRHKLDDTSYSNRNAEIKFCIFHRNEAKLSGGAIYSKNIFNNTITINFHDSSLTRNMADHGGGAIYWSCTTERCEVNINGGFDALGNSAKNGGAMYVDGVDIRYIIDNATIKFTENIAEYKGGALFILNSRYIWETQFIITFTHNAVTSADGKGGAVYVEDVANCFVSTCFISFDNNRNRTDLLEFDNNVAAHGPVLYGGFLDRCTLGEDNPTKHGIDYFKQISSYNHTPLAVTSDLVGVCLCNSESQIDCSKREINLTKMRGETIKLTATSVDQDENPGLSIIRAFYVEPLAELDVGEWRNTANRMCTNLSYHIFTIESSATLVLQLLDKCENSTLSTITVHIQLTPCSKGFELHNNTCACDRRLAQYFDICSVNSRSVQRKGPTWLRYDQHHLKLSTNCPLDYCQVSSPTISLLSPDQQCANHRSGILCGACKDNYSITMGGSKCSRCTSSYTAIGWTVLFAVAGLALVALLLVCNMTISAGTLNGLIFYANVVSISGLTSLHNCSLCPILRVFLAWLNLDWGLQTCFYSGMDTYHKTWLQLAFPLYIWCLVTAIILASHYSSKAMRVFGTNNMPILATLFILSYTKILKTITTALSVTQVLQSHPDNTTHQLTPYGVWTYDGNVEYLKGKHVALFAVALFLLLFLFLPYTLLLIFGQCVRSMSVKRCLWVSRCVRSTAFVSIVDAYHAPYNKRHRYWTGLMLLIRCLLFLAFASSYGNTDPLLSNMYITTVVTSCILIYKVFVRNVIQTGLHKCAGDVLSCQLGNPVGYSDFPQRQQQQQ